MQSTEKFTNLDTVKDRLGYVLKLAAWTPAEAARKIPASASYISLILSGKRENLGAGFLRKLSELGVRPDWLQRGEGEPPKVIQSIDKPRESTSPHQYHLETATDEDLLRLIASASDQLKLADRERTEALLESISALKDEQYRRRVNSPPKDAVASPEQLAGLGAAGVAKQLAQELPLKSKAGATSAHKPSRGGAAPPGKKS